MSARSPQDRAILATLRDLNTRVAKVAQDIGNGALASVAPEDFRYFTTWDTEGSQTRR